MIESDMPELHMMVDLETLDVKVSACIVTIGAVMFDPRSADTEETLTDTFYVRINMASSQKAGRTFGADTLAWWIQQGKENPSTLAELIDGEQTNQGIALFNFRKWITDREIKPARCWAKSPDFDCSILSSAMDSENERWPFHFAAQRCVRTAVDLAYPDGDAPVIGVGAAHNALDDSLRQALMIQSCYRALNC